MRKIFKFLLWLIVALLLSLGVYIAFVLVSLDRIEDNQELDVSNQSIEVLDSEKEYKLISFNIGFGAYEPDFGFFMDGGTEAWAFSQDRLDKNLKNIGSFLKEENADFYMIQEVDVGSTRSYFFDQISYISDALSNYNYTFAYNYDCPFLCYPLLQPSGSSKAGLMSLSKTKITSAIRRSLPSAEGLGRLVELDRCCSVNRIALDNGKDLVIINFHLICYTKDPSIGEAELEMLLDIMQSEYDKGNYCIACGDCNKDIDGRGSEIFGVIDSEYAWAMPINKEAFKTRNVQLISPLDINNPVATCRNADGPYTKDQYQVVIDGFMVTDNINVVESSVIDTGFKYSDHNPVKLLFSLD